MYPAACYFLGGFGRLFSDQVNIAADGFDSIIPTMLSNLTPILIALVVILVLSASMSTLSSLVIASSSTLTIDFLRRHVYEEHEPAQAAYHHSRILIFVFIAISAVIAIVQYKSNVTFIAQLMGISWGALAGAFLAPFLYGLYWKRTSRLACWVCFIFGCGLMIANMLFRTSFPTLLQSPINCGAVAMIVGLVLVPVISLISPAPNKEIVDDAFSCYDKETTVPQKTALGK